jgi:ABC-2 type transport system permease protein
MRLGAYLGLIENCFKTQLTYRLNLLVETINPFVGLAIMWFVWKAVYASSPTPVINGYAFPAMITYAAISSIISSYTWMNTEFDVQNEVKSGSIAAILIKPISYPIYRFAVDTGGTTTWLLLTKLPIIAFAFAVLGISGPASPLFFLSAFLGFLVNYLMVFLTALWCFWTVGDVWGIKFARQMISNVVSGALVPLTFFPVALQNVFNLLPFQAVFYAPLSIYIGTVTGYAALATMAVQLAWIGVLFAVTYMAWHFTMRRVVVQGG